MINGKKQVIKKKKKNEIKQQQDYLDSDDFISVCNKMRNIVCCCIPINTLKKCFPIYSRFMNMPSKRRANLLNYIAKRRYEQSLRNCNECSNFTDEIIEIILSYVKNPILSRNIQISYDRTRICTHWNKEDISPYGMQNNERIKEWIITGDLLLLVQNAVHSQGFTGKFKLQEIYYTIVLFPNGKNKGSAGWIEILCYPSSKIRKNVKENENCKFVIRCKLKVNEKFIRCKMSENGSIAFFKTMKLSKIQDYHSLKIKLIIDILEMNIKGKEKGKNKGKKTGKIKSIKTKQLKKQKAIEAIEQIILSNELRNIGCCCIPIAILIKYPDIYAKYQNEDNQNYKKYDMFEIAKICYEESIKNAIDNDMSLRLTDEIMNSIWIFLGKPYNLKCSRNFMRIRYECRHCKNVLDCLLDNDELRNIRCCCIPINTLKQYKVFYAKFCHAKPMQRVNILNKISNRRYEQAIRNCNECSNFTNEIIQLILVFMGNPIKSKKKIKCIHCNHTDIISQFDNYTSKKEGKKKGKTKGKKKGKKKGKNKTKRPKKQWQKKITNAKSNRILHTVIEQVIFSNDLRNIECCCIPITIFIKYPDIYAKYEENKKYDMFEIAKICYEESIKNAIDNDMSLTDEIMNSIWIFLGKPYNLKCSRNFMRIRYECRHCKNVLDCLLDNDELRNIRCCCIPINTLKKYKVINV
eukprot:203377_1